MIVHIQQATIVNEGKQFVADVIIENEYIKTISNTPLSAIHADKVIDAKHLLLMPGCIDDQVHFREPGLTHKAHIESEAKAAVAGGITSFMEMPNTVPNTLTQPLLQQKYDRAEEVSLANYSFFMGASNDNLSEVLLTNPKQVCGVKVFMGSSTGNMLVDNAKTLEGIFKECPMLIATHCEDEETIKANLKKYTQQFGEDIPIKYHPIIRDAEACYKSSSMAVELATKHNARLHILHISSAKEIGLFSSKPLSEKRITAEACIHHMWFTDADYEQKQTLIKWNPAVKSFSDREAIRAAVNSNKIDVIATDHAPHTSEEKANNYVNAPSGGPLVQHALPAMLQMVKQKVFTIEKVVEKMCHAPAELFNIDKRGYIKEGYFADLVLVDMNKKQTVQKSNILYHCGWSPFEGETFDASVIHTFVNGHLAYSNGELNTSKLGKRLTFNR